MKRLFGSALALDRMSRVGRALAVLAGAILVFGWSQADYPIADWLVCRLAVAWVSTLVLLVSSLGFGLFILDKIDPSVRRFGERFVVAMALGIWGFFVCVFVLGLAGCLQSWLFFVLPAALMALSWRQLARTAKQWIHVAGSVGARLVLPRNMIEAAALIVGCLGLLFFYTQACTPTNLGADTHWYHLPIAEHYAASGAIRPFFEGWYLGAYPQLASILYTWAFLLPGAELVDRVLLSAHIEFSLFALTLFGISVLVRRLLGGGRHLYTGAVLFLFPGIFVYDSNLIVGADHVLAFFTPALGLAFLRWDQRFELRPALVVAIVLAGAALTKSQAVYLVAASAIWTLVLMLRHRRVRPALALAFASLLCTAPHWLKNVWWYGDPIYPLLHARLDSHPLYTGATALFEKGLLFQPFHYNGRPGLHFVGALLRNQLDFAFVPHNWHGMHGHRAVFGFLYTLLAPFLLIERAGRRALWLILATQIGVAAWFCSFQLDRYLQTLLPWMAAVTAVSLTLLWRRGAWVRCGAALLVTAQILTGADLPFYRTHGMIADSHLKAFVDLVAAGHLEGDRDKRFRISLKLQDLGASLPPHSIVLLHEIQERLGLGAPSVSDRLRWQGRFHYARAGTLRAAVELVRQSHATHAVWLERLETLSIDGVANEAVFAKMATELVGPVKKFGGYQLAELALPPRQDVADAPVRIGVVSCDASVPTGVYEQRSLATGGKPVSLGPASVSSADVLVFQAGCAVAAPFKNRKKSRHFSTASGWEIWVKLKARD